MRLPELYHCAHAHQIPVLRHPMPLCGSLSIQTETGCVIGMDESICDQGSQERTHLSHELGHCLTGSFYNVYTPFDLRRRHENRADKWAVRALVPAKALDEAVASGVCSLWELAEHFGVTEDFMRKAVCLHVHGNLATELYF